MSTITAICTPSGVGAIGVIRISGDEALEIASKFINAPKLNNFMDAKSHYMYFAKIDTPKIKERCMAVYFKSPESFTGEDTVELYCHGGTKLLQLIIELIVDCGANYAQNGEFTKRAFLNGKLALSDAEGIIDLINAESESAINAGYRLMTGKLTQQINKSTKKLLTIISNLEVALDYPDELDEETHESSKILLVEVIDELYELESTTDIGMYIKNGINVAIIGAPNAGKSSLLNALLQDERAIVSNIAGTTRDTIEESIIYKGIKINFIDTAGIRSTVDEIENKGVERSYKAINGADIIINLIDSTTGENIYKNENNKTVLNVFNKNDIVEVDEKELSISAKNGQGIQKILDKVVSFTQSKTDNGEIITSLRHKKAISDAIVYLKQAYENYEIMPSDCILVDIRSAYYKLGEIDGSFASEKIVDDIFSRFCVGK